MSVTDVYNPANYKVQSTSGSSNGSGPDRFENLGVDDFMRLMVAQLQNQDPMNPTDNKDMLAQLNMMRQIASSDKLGLSMDSIMLGQSVATASNLLGKTVTGIDSIGEEISGVVDRVVFEAGQPKVYIGKRSLALSSVTQIVPTATATPEATADVKNAA
ncbi:MAG: flagellar hook assembly protein FlgD [Thermoguttaceae bacterium]